MENYLEKIIKDNYEWYKKWFDKQDCQFSTLNQEQKFEYYLDAVINGTNGVDASNKIRSTIICEVIKNLNLNN